MTLVFSRWVWARAVVVVCPFLFGPAAVLAQGAPDIRSAAPVQVGERLSDWLLRNAPTGTDTTALHWRVPSERAAQMRLRQAVAAALPAHGVLAQWLEQLPVTGRLNVARADARWLQGALAQDPVLGEGQSVLLLQRPQQVAVLNETGRRCLLPHRATAILADYLRQCAEGDVAQDWVWLVQADGHVQRTGVAAWNLQAAEAPGPGAWIWAPSRAAAIAPSTSDNLARFLATQLPAESLAAGSATEAQQVMQAWPTAVDLTAYRSPPRDPMLSASDWGEIGLLQTPSARVAPAGEVRMVVSGVYPYTRFNVMLQPLSWMEVGFRYTDIANQLYGPAIADGQTYKDKSMDVKFHLLDEGPYRPELSLGVRDISGTGLFSSEYVVANKRWGNWDWSAGVGWGYMGARGNLGTPLGFLGDSFKTRPVVDIGQGGNFSTQDMFHGPAAAFGGVQWNTPITGLMLKAELDGNDYSAEPFGTTLPASSPMNFGAVYRYAPGVDWSVGWERGNTLMFSLNLHTSLEKLEAPKLLDPVLARPQVAPSSAPVVAWATTAQDLGRFTGWSVHSIRLLGDRVEVSAESDAALFVQDRIDRAATVLHRDMPASVARFVFHFEQYGVAMSDVEIDRAEWVAQHTQPVPPSFRLNSQRTAPGTSTARSAAAAAQEGMVYAKPQGSDTSWIIGPSYSQMVGGPDAFLLYQLGVDVTLEHHFDPSNWVTVDVNGRILDNYNLFRYDAPSNLPRVRTYIREYVTTSTVTMPVMQATHVSDMGGGNYFSAYGGMLESMFGGVGAEWLYRPWQSRLAFGVDMNHVRQRDFGQNLAFQDYEVNTGHATMYWDTGWNDLQVRLAAGQYLAGDVGATMEVKRVFHNGTSIGAWFTKTNVSADQFGEGSFDKGIYVSMPFDLMLPRSSAGTVSAVWHPLLRDGGAMLDRNFSLFDFTLHRDPRTWSASSKSVDASDDRYQSAQDRSYVLSEPGNWGDYVGNAATGLGRGLAAVPGSTWAWGAGLVLASSLFDSQVDAWAQNHQTDNWNRIGAAANNLPYALALGTGLMFMGVAGEDGAATAATSITAAAFTMGGNLLTKLAVGRARPGEDLGPGSFNGMTSSAAQSSFASDHVAAAFALATPFAQQYDQPWLYAVAAATGLGRIQSRDHWLSDTVAGGLMGYAVGSICYEQQLGYKRSMQLSANLQSVQARWSF